MNAKQFLAKYPNTLPAQDHLHDRGCPECGQREHLLVEVLMFVEMTEEGTDPFSDATKDYGDSDYDGTSNCRCPDCGYAGTVRHFTFRGLDDLINKP